MGLIAGLDIGSAFSKAVVLDNGDLVSHGVRATEGDFAQVARSLLDDVLEKRGLTPDDLDLIGASGLGASFVPYPHRKIADISCHSRGAHYFLPSVRTLVEIGNQVSRVIKVSPKGMVADSATGDKCAAGSGRILQIVAKVLKIDLKDMGKISAQAARPAKFTTGCAVFLETETISRVAEGTPKADIIAGLHQTLATRISVMAHRLKVEADCVFVGGGALDAGLAKVVEKELREPLFVPEEPLLSGAIGAALVAAERSAGS